MKNNFLKISLITGYKTSFCTLLFFVLTLNLSYGQKTSKEEKRLYKKAKKQLTNEDFKNAQANYLKLVQLSPKDEIYCFEGGLSYYFSDFERAKCIPLFESSLDNSKEDTIPEIYYYLARAYHFNGQYEKSTVTFNKFKPHIKISSNAGKELLRQSDHYIEVSDNGKKYLANINENIKVNNLGKDINSSYGEYAPVLKASDGVLLFTSRRKGSSNKTDKDLLPYEDVYVAKETNGVWQILTDKKEVEKYIPSSMNTKKHDAGIIYSSDGKTLYTYQNDAIWKSILENGKWSDLVALDKNINSSRYNIPSITLSKDENTIFFVSYRKDGIGGKDIYKSIKTSDGTWGKAENLGETINTKLDEDSPFISEDGNTLYFSSKGHSGIGGYDVFKSQLNDGVWSSPENMGIPINSSVDDIYFIIRNDGINGFLASSREDGIGGMDIYSFCTECPTTITNTINGLLVDNNNNPIESGSITLKKDHIDTNIETYLTIAGKFDIVTENSGKHQLIVEAPNFEKHLFDVDLPTTSSQSDLKIQLSQFDKGDDTYQIIAITSTNLGLNKSDTIKVDKLIVATEPIDDNTSSSSTETSNSSGSSSTTVIASYQENFSYNKKAINTSNAEFTAMLSKAVSKGGKIYVSIESSASHVPTSTFKDNINLASLRGDETKIALVKALIAKGINEKDIVVNSINSFVSGPKYTGDHKNVEKYSKFQYVKVTIK